MYGGRRSASLAEWRRDLIEMPDHLSDSAATDEDALSGVLRTIRLTGSLQFCWMPSGSWQTDGKPRLAKLAEDAMPFHIMVEGTCWLRTEGQEHVLAAGDVITFPFGTAHQLGAGSGGRLITPFEGLPPKPWRHVPILQYGNEEPGVRLLCGYLQCDAINFRPLRDALPNLVHVRTHGADDARWLSATVAQMVAEVDQPRTGGLSMLERLTEITFIELLRHQIIGAKFGSTGWLAALADPSLARCLPFIHDDPRRALSLQALAAASGLSRSTLAERFEAVLGTSPMRYVREWRLYLARVALSTTRKSIAAIAHEAGYGTEAAFNRAFSRAYGEPPAMWRQKARRRLAGG